MSGKTTRRDTVLGLSAVLGGLSATGARAALTPRASEGPFYPLPSMQHADRDNDLVKIRPLVEAAKGEVVILRGRLRREDGTPLANHRVEIWQCDVNGNYLHTADRGSADHDAGFQGFGYDITDQNGAFSFRTIKPAVYPGRTPHIHAKVLNGRREVLTTQFYIAGHPDNRRDALFRRMSDAQAAAVSMTFAPEGDEMVARLDIVV